MSKANYPQGFALANGISHSFYQELGRNPSRAQRFGLAMSAFTTGDEYSMRHLVAGYLWDQLPSGSTIVDIGGSHGDAAFALAESYPDLNIIVQELPEVVENAKSREREGVKVKFMPHNMFDPQPIRASIYLLRSVLHNWPDSYAICALQALIPALRPGARVLLMEGIMPGRGELENMEERRVRTMDLVMMEVGNAKERSEEEWKKLFEEADGRWRWVGVRTMVGSALGILEAVWEGDGDGGDWEEKTGNTVIEA